MYGYDNIPRQSTRSRRSDAAVDGARIATRSAPRSARRPRLPGSDHLQLHRSQCCRGCCSQTQTRAGARESDLGRLGVMRVSLWPGLVEPLRGNQRRQQQRVRLFEVGRVSCARRHGWSESRS